MFVQGLIYLAIAMITAWILWKYIILEILEENKLIEDEPLATPHTIELDNLKAKLAELSVSANSAVESSKIRKRIQELEELIAKADADELEAQNQQ